MNFNCQREDLLLGIQTVGRAISVKHTLPVLSGILIIAENNLLTLRATNLDIAVECNIPADVATAGTMVIADGRRFIELVRQLPEETLNISLINDFDASIKYSGANLNIRGFDSEQFPILPGMESKIQGVMAGAAFAKMVKQVGIAASSEESRPVLTGIMIEMLDDQLTMVATDSHRLAKVSAAWQGEATERIIVPAKTLLEVGKLAQNEENISIIISKNNVCFKMGSITFISRLINGQFPDYNPILPREDSFKYKIYINKSTLLDSLSRANLLSRDNNNVIKLDIKADGITMMANSPDVGNIEERLAATVVGEELLIGYNVKYILDALKVIESETVEIKLTGALTPGIIVPEAEENYVYLLLPVRING